MATAAKKAKTAASQKSQTSQTNELGFYNELINVDDLNIDRGYQRALDENRVKKIAREWDDTQARDVYVSRRDHVEGSSSYWILDGQHTFAAAQMIGKKQLNCRIYTDLSRKDEADMYFRLNDAQQKPSTIDKFKAAKVAGYPDEIQLDKILKERGLVATRKNPRDGDENIDKSFFPVTAVQQLLTALRKHGSDHVSLMLDIIVNGWGKENAAFNVHILNGLSRFLQDFDKKTSTQHAFDMDRMVTVMRSVPPSMVMERANKHRNVVGNRPLAVAEAFDEIYRVPSKVGIDMPTIRKRWTRRG